jgi:hypothetical protein
MKHGELGSESSPTPEEFEEASQRELARLNFRISSMTGQSFRTPEDSKLLEGDRADRRLADMATVGQWIENSARPGGGAKIACEGGHTLVSRPRRRRGLT